MNRDFVNSADGALVLGLTSKTARAPSFPGLSTSAGCASDQFDRLLRI
jgi:hypothetical protein